MRLLLLTSFLLVTTRSARADRDDTLTGRRELVQALAKRDVATIQARALLPLQLHRVWFDTDACKKFSGDAVNVGSDQLAELVGCIADLGVQLIDDKGLVLATYGPGLMLTIVTSVDGKQLWALSNLAAKDGTPLVHPDAFTQHVENFQREVAPDATTKKIIDGAPGFRAEAQVVVCNDESGTRARTFGPAKPVILGTKTAGETAPDSTRAPAAYGELIDKAVAAWKLTPFVAHGKPVRACTVLVLGYPQKLLPDHVALPSSMPPPLATTPPPDAGAPTKVSPTVLEATRISGEKIIVPDDATKAEIKRSKLTKVIGTFKLCVGTDGKVVDVQPLKSTGFEAYDRKLVAAIWKWVYKPFVVKGQAVPVCTAVTFIYD